MVTAGHSTRSSVPGRWVEGGNRLGWTRVIRHRHVTLTKMSKFCDTSAVDGIGQLVGEGDIGVREWLEGQEGTRAGTGRRWPWGLIMVVTGVTVGDYWDVGDCPRMKPTGLGQLPCLVAGNRAV